MDESTSCDLFTFLSVVATMWIPRVGRRQLFLKLHKLENADAAAVTNALLEVLIEFGLKDELPKKLVGVAADGASTFQGQLGGVIARVVASMAPFTVGTHCPAHRINLVAQSLDDALLQKLVQVTTVVNNHFSKSSKRMQSYAAVQKTLDLPAHK